MRRSGNCARSHSTTERVCDAPPTSPGSVLANSEIACSTYRGATNSSQMSVRASLNTSSK